MASSLQKKVRLRAGRLVEQLVELRPQCVGDDERLRLEECIGIARLAAGDLEDTFSGYKPAPRPRRSAPVITYPQGLQPPVRGPGSGVVEALPRAPKGWAAREMMRRDADGGGRQAAPAPAPAPAPYMAATADDILQAEAFLRDCEREGDLSSYYTTMAFAEVCLLPAWKSMDAIRRAELVRSRAEEMAIDEGQSDVDEEMDDGTFVSGPPVATPSVGTDADDTTF